MNEIKYKAVRQTLINTDLDIIVNWQVEKGLTDLSIHKLAEHFIDNGADGIDIDFQYHLRQSLIKYIDKHTLIAQPFIVRDVMDYKGDLLSEDWDMVWNKIYRTIPRYDNVCYIVIHTIQYNGDVDNDAELFSDFQSAKKYFNRFKEDLKKEYPDAEITDEDDFVFNSMMEDDVRNVYTDLYITKKPIH